MLFLILFLIPSLFIAWLIYIASRKIEKPWLKPFFSHVDFLKELYAISAVGLFASFWWRIFAEIVKANPDNKATWFLELWILGFIAFIFVLGWYARSYFNIIFGVISSVIYIAVEMVKWSYDNYFFILKDRMQESYVVSLPGDKIITPTAAFGLFWVLINLIYFVGKYFSQTKVLGRVGNLIRALVIFNNVVFLSILSNSGFINYGVRGFLGGNPIFHSLPLLILTFIIIILVVYAVILTKKINLSLSEIAVSLIPGLVFLMYSIFPFIRLSENSNSFEANPFKIIWAIIFNTLYLVYGIYLINKSSKTNERWLKTYSIILVVGILIDRFIDIGISFSFSGIYLTVFGGVIMIAAALVELSKRKSLTK